MRTLSALLATTALAALLGACAGNPLAVDGGPAPKRGDEGVVIASSRMITGVTDPTASTITPNDCHGPGLGVEVEGSFTDNKYLYDANGEPCDIAQTLFDGRTKVDQRAADPAITLTFHADKSLAPEEEEPARPAAQTAAVATSPTTPQTIGAPAGKLAEPTTATPPARVVAEVAPSKPDPLMVQLSAWKAQDRAAILRTEEATAAAKRNMESLAQENRTGLQEEYIAQLSAKLRERERQIEEEQRRHTDTLARAAQNRDQTSAAKAELEKQQTSLQTELESTRTRLKQFEELTAQLQAEKTEKEQAYQSKIKDLSSNLKVAEQQADASRRELVIEAAAKIAQAEQLAHLANVQEQEAKLREAERLKVEAEVMMDRALALRAGESVQSVLAKGTVSATNVEQVPLEQAVVNIHAKNQPLEDLLATILKQAEPQAGKWAADWQLSGKSQYILQEKWSLTAEAPVQQILLQLATQVAQAHKIPLTFTQFAKSRLLVVTDTPDAAQSPSQE